MLAVPPELVGIPFVAGGRVAAGCDCWGLLRLAMAVILDIQLPRLDPAGDIDVAHQVDEQGWRRLPAHGERPGDALLIRVEGWPAHVALVVGHGLMLHTTEGDASRIERYRGPVWRHRIVAAYRHPAMAGRRA